MDDHEKAIRQRLKDDFAHYAARCLKIRSKSGAILPLTLNTAQMHLHNRIEQQRTRIGMVRILVLKGRQQGCSTYTEGRFYHLVTHRFGVRAFILAHDLDSSKTIFEMVERFQVHCSPLVRPLAGTSNARELVFPRLDSGYEVATAGNKAAGRSKTVQYFHGSEVAFWPNAEQHLRGVLQTIPREIGTEVILESTSDGPQGVFYDMCTAAGRGDGEYELVFIPWYWDSGYRTEVPADFQRTAEEEAYADKYGVDDGQLAWRRLKIIELQGVEGFQREYPADIEEAFEAPAEGALWTPEMIKSTRVAAAPHFSRIVVAIDPSVSRSEKSDECGIVVAGIGSDGHGYVLEDLTSVMPPHLWASRAVQAYHQWQADRIIGEVNNGGDLVEINLRTVDENIPYKAVHASRGKRTRAEPIAALYAQGRVHHVGTHTALERQMTTWEPKSATYSPGRIDAMVWAISELMLEPQGSYFERL
jgi:hypothetical protein